MRVEIEFVRRDGMVTKDAAPEELRRLAEKFVIAQLKAAFPTATVRFKKTRISQDVFSQG